MQAFVCVKPAVRNFKYELRSAAEFAVKNQLSRVISKSGLVLQWNLTSFDVFRVESQRQQIGSLGFRIRKVETRLGKVIVQ